MLLNMETIIQQKAAIVKNQARITDLLGWTFMEYSSLIYNSGLAYLKLFCQHDEEAIGKLVAHADFWNWWKHQWNIRDHVFVFEMDGLEDRITVDQFRRVYIAHNLPSILVSEIAPAPMCYPPDFPIIKIQMK
jgi:hypothetical protein